MWNLSLLSGRFSTGITSLKTIQGKRIHDSPWYSQRFLGFVLLRRTCGASVALLLHITKELSQAGHKNGLNTSLFSSLTTILMYDIIHAGYSYKFSLNDTMSLQLPCVGILRSIVV